MSSDSLRRRLHEARFAPLPEPEYLARLRIVANTALPSEQRAAAKEELLQSHLRLIAGSIRSYLNSVCQIHGAPLSRTGIGIDEMSDLINSMAGAIHADMTDMAQRATTHRFSLAAAIIDRVCKRLCSKVRAATAQKRTTGRNGSELVEHLISSHEPIDTLEALVIQESAELLRAAVSDLPETQAMVFEAFMHGLDAQQDITQAKIAEQLNMPPTTVRSAFQAGRKKLQAMFPDFVPQASDSQRLER